MFKLASWNVNSLKVRLDQVLTFMDESKIDVLGLQETKVIDEQFPIQAFTERGYFVVFSGQKTYNGVAIVSRKPLTDVVMGVPDFEDPQRRIIAATIGDLRLINLYVPNGAQPATDKYYYKLNWLSQVTAWIKEELKRYPNLAVVGDFNIAPTDLDVHDPQSWVGGVLVSPSEREAFSALLELGLKDSFRARFPEKQVFSWWDYRAAGFRRNHGCRIDHILMSDTLNASCIDVGIEIEPRCSERPSDHAPVWGLLGLLNGFMPR